MLGLTEFDIPDSVTMIGNLFSGVSGSGDAGNFSVTQFQLNWDATELATMTSNSPDLATNFLDI